MNIGKNHAQLGRSGKMEGTMECLIQDVPRWKEGGKKVVCYCWTPGQFKFCFCAPGQSVHSIANNDNVVVGKRLSIFVLVSIGIHTFHGIVPSLSKYLPRITFAY